MQPQFSQKPFLLSNKTKDFVVFFICLMCLALFSSSAYDKLDEHSKFINSLSKVAYIGAHADMIGWIVPIVELIISVLLIVPKTNKLGLYGFVGTMIVFTIYILSMIFWAEKLPCRCNLIIEKLTWRQHIWFNLAFIAIATYALILKQNLNLNIKKMNNLQKTAIALSIGVMAIGVSAFKSAPKNSSKFATYYYTLIRTSPTTYVYDKYGEIAPNLEPCTTGPSNVCVISYPSDQGQTLNPASLPSGSTNYSGTNGFWDN